MSHTSCILGSLGTTAAVFAPNTAVSPLPIDTLTRNPLSGRTGNTSFALVPPPNSHAAHPPMSSLFRHPCGFATDDMGRGNEQPSLDSLIETFLLADVFIRRGVVDELKRHGDAAIGFLVDVALRDGDDGTAIAAARALGDTGSWSAVEGLHAAQDEASPAVRIAIAEALEDIRNANSLPEIDEKTL